jgi:hypothetical protein
MCATILVLLNGFAAIYIAYPPQISIHPENIGASHGEKTASLLQITRAASDYSERKKGTQEANSKKQGKSSIFFGGCAKQADFMRFGATRAAGFGSYRYAILHNHKLSKEKEP